jgi:hypothetical protein
MRHTFEVDNEEYALLEEAARRQGSTPDALFQAWLKGVTSTSQREIEEARARWQSLGPSVQAPSDEELALHPLLRVIGIGAVDEPGWADEHDAVFGGTVDHEGDDGE